MSATRQGGGPRQQVVDSEPHRCDFVQVPFLLLQDIAHARLQPSAAVLWLYYKRRAWECHGGNLPPSETLRETEQRSGLSRGTILSARKALAENGWAEVQVEGCRRDQLVRVTLLERWDENCRGHSPGAVQNLDKAAHFVRNPDDFVQKPANSDQNLDKVELEPGIKTEEDDVKDTQQHARAREDGTDPGAGQPGLPRFQVQLLPVDADDLVAAVYRGGRRDRQQLTESMARREVAIARQLIVAGASPPEAEAWAREAAEDPRRHAPIDMRAYERERVEWLGRRRAVPREGPRLVDRTGQPPVWELPRTAGARP